MHRTTHAPVTCTYCSNVYLVHEVVFTLCQTYEKDFYRIVHTERPSSVKCFKVIFKVFYFLLKIHSCIYTFLPSFVCSFVQFSREAHGASSKTRALITNFKSSPVLCNKILPFRRSSVDYEKFELTF